MFGLNKMLEINMPGESYTGPVELVTDDEKYTAQQLRDHVYFLADTVGERSTRVEGSLTRTANYIVNKFRELGLHVYRLDYRTAGGHVVENIEAVLPGTDDENGQDLIIGAHYDSVNCAGADDNASGVAGLLELARIMVEAKYRPAKTVRFVAFVNEEPPYFNGPDMGSVVYATNMKKAGKTMHGMICLESIGYYSEEPGSQTVPELLKPLFPYDKGDFIGFFSNMASLPLLKETIAAFRTAAQLPSEGLAASSLIPALNFSDHASFYPHQYPAIMVCNSAFMRNPNYHTKSDTPDTLDWTRFTKLVGGLSGAIMEMAQ